SPEAHDTALRTDKLLDKLFRNLDAQVGMSNVLVVLTADHGASAVPEVSIARKIGGGRIPPFDVRDAVEARLEERFGKEKWIMSVAGGLNPKFFEFLNFYLDRELIRQKKLDVNEVERFAADAARAIPHIARVYTRSQLSNGYAMGDAIGRRIQNGFFAP